MEARRRRVAKPADGVRAGRAETDSCDVLRNSLARLKSETVKYEKGRLLWNLCVSKVRDELRYRQRGTSTCCSRFAKGLVLCTLLLIGIFVLFYFCKPASFLLRKHIHSKLYYISRTTRRTLIALDPYLQCAGVNMFDGCMIKNPFISSKVLCPSKHDINETTNMESLMVDSLFEEARKAKWWTVKSAMKVSNKVTLDQLYSVENNGQVPNMCEQVVGGGKEGEATVLYEDVFNKQRMNMALKVEYPWSVSWIECPDKANNLTVHSVFPTMTFLSDTVIPSNKSLISLSTKWCITYHYQNGLPSTLLNFVVVSGEVVIIPVIVDTDQCVGRSSRLWQNAVFLSEGDMVILDNRFWSYEVQTLSDYSITMTLSMCSSES